MGAGVQGAYGLGLGGQYSITPEDARAGHIFGGHRFAYSIGIGPTCGIGLSGGISGVEYIPIITVRENGSTDYHLDDYLYDHPDMAPPDSEKPWEGQYNNGFITGFGPEDLRYYTELIQEKIKDQGWDN